MAVRDRLLIMLPGPTNVPDRVMRAMIKPIIGHRTEAFHKLYEEIREKLKYVFQTEGDVYALTCSGTGGVYCSISNTIKPGDKVLVPDYGFFTNRVREKVVERGGKLIDPKLEWGSAPTKALIEEIFEKEKIDVVIIVHNETSTGVKVVDLPEICRVAKEHGALTIVDAVSILGGDELPVDKWNIDICVTGSQKCLACPPGLALISVSEDAWKAIKRVENRPYYFDLLRVKSYYDEKREHPFTPALPIMFALNEALQIIVEEGLEKRFERHKRCAKAFYSAFEAMGMSFIPKPEFRSNTVVAVKKPDEVNDIEVRSKLEKDYGVLVAGGLGEFKGKAFRVGCMGAISEFEVIATISAFESALLDVGYEIELGVGVKAARKSLKIS